MTARTFFLQASALEPSTCLRRTAHFIIERSIITDIYHARISRYPSFSCRFHCCSRFRCSSLVCCHLHGCASDDPADLPILNSYFNARSKDRDAALGARGTAPDYCIQCTSQEIAGNLLAPLTYVVIFTAVKTPLTCRFSAVNLITAVMGLGDIPFPLLSRMLSSSHGCDDPADLPISQQ